MGQLTEFGFKRKRLEDIIEEMKEAARGAFGANINLDSDRSKILKFIKVLAEREAANNEAMEDLYNSIYYDTAEGVNMDRLAKTNIGLTRIREDYATGTVEFSVDPNKTINKGIIVSTETDIDFVTLEGGTEIGGKITVPIKALAAGSISNVAASAIKVIKTPLAGVKSVNNPTATEGGRDAETTAEFRGRYEKSLGNGGTTTVESVRAALLALPDVKDAIVTENDTNATVSGVPANSIAPLVYGGDDADIAQAIFTKKPGGIRSFGSTIVNATDNMGFTHPIGFSRPTVVPVWIRATLTKNSSYPTDGNAQVKTAIIKYIGGTDADSAVYDGLNLGEDVIRYKVSSAAGAIVGIDDLLIETSLDGTTWNESNISINSTGIAITDYDKVVIL